jgi:hypothetical protein
MPASSGAFCTFQHGWLAVLANIIGQRWSLIVIGEGSSQPSRCRMSTSGPFSSLPLVTSPRTPRWAPLPASSAEALGAPKRMSSRMARMRPSRRRWTIASGGLEGRPQQFLVGAHDGSLEHLLERGDGADSAEPVVGDHNGVGIARRVRAHLVATASELAELFVGAASRRVRIRGCWALDVPRHQ